MYDKIGMKCATSSHGMMEMLGDRVIMQILDLSQSFGLQSCNIKN